MILSVTAQNVRDTTKAELRVKHTQEKFNKWAAKLKRNEERLLKEGILYTTSMAAYPSCNPPLSSERALFWFMLEISMWFQYYAHSLGLLLSIQRSHTQSTTILE